MYLRIRLPPSGWTVNNCLLIPKMIWWWFFFQVSWLLKHFTGYLMPYIACALKHLVTKTSVALKTLLLFCMERGNLFYRSYNCDRFVKNIQCGYSSTVQTPLNSLLCCHCFTHWITNTIPPLVCCCNLPSFLFHKLNFSLSSAFTTAFIKSDLRRQKANLLAEGQTVSVSTSASAT